MVADNDLNMREQLVRLTAENNYLKMRIQQIAEDALSCSGCSHEDVLKDSLKEISEDLIKVLEGIPGQ